MLGAGAARDLNATPGGLAGVSGDMLVTTGSTEYADVVATLVPGLLRLALMLTGDPQRAEDLVQATLTRMHRHRERLVGMDAPGVSKQRVTQLLAPPRPPAA